MKTLTFCVKKQLSGTYEIESEVQPTFPMNPHVVSCIKRFVVNVSQDYDQINPSQCDITAKYPNETAPVFITVNICKL